MKKSICFIIIFCFLFTSCFAETVYLKDGNVLRVTIKKENADSIEVFNGVRKYEILKKDILRVGGKEISGIGEPTPIVPLEERVNNLEKELKETKENELLLPIGTVLFVLSILYFISVTSK